MTVAKHALMVASVSVMTFLAALLLKYFFLLEIGEGEHNATLMAVLSALPGSVLYSMLGVLLGYFFWKKKVIALTAFLAPSIVLFSSYFIASERYIAPYLSSYVYVLTPYFAFLGLFCFCFCFGSLWRSKSCRLN